MPSFLHIALDPSAERRARHADRRLLERSGTYRGPDRRTLVPDRRDAIDTLGDALAALARIEADCHAIDVAAELAEALWSRATAEYERTEAAWTEIRGDRSRKRAALAKLQARVAELKGM